jgi:peptide-methionine (S)-S-oxide reductase
MKHDVITLGGGCFWCLETAFNTVEGVVSAYSGYSNGHADNPSYEQVCSGDTGHNEVVQVTFDTDSLSLRQVLEIFFALHDPTQLNRQGNDVGTQYRSGIYYHNDEQKKAAQEIIKEIEETEIWPNPVVTEVLAVDNYSQAEDYHQDYFSNNPQNQYCNMVVAPKLAKFKKTFASKLKSSGL